MSAELLTPRSPEDNSLPAAPRLPRASLWRRSGRAAGLALALLAAPFAASAPGAEARAMASADEPCFEGWWRAKLEEARRERRDASAFLPLRQAADLAHSARDPQQVAAGIAKLAALDDLHPHVRAEAERLLLEHALRRGRLDEARRHAAALGLVQRYALAGPLESDEEVAAARAALENPELFDEAWRVVAPGPAGILPLHEVLFPTERRRALVAFLVELDDERDVVLHLGGDERVRAWVNGRLELERTPRRGLAFDQESLPLALGPGAHRVVVEVEQEVGPWGLVARVTDLEGRPLGDALRHPDPRELPGRAGTLGALGRPPRARAPLSLHAALEEQARRGGALERALLALDMHLRTLPSEESDEALTIAREAAAAAPRDPRVLFVQSLVEREASRGRAALEAMLQADADHPAALRKLVDYHFNFGRYEEARALAERALAACGQPDPFLEAQVALARDVQGFPGGALATLRALSERAPEQPLIAERHAGLAQRAGLYDEARAGFARVLSLNRADGSTLAALLSLLRDAGEAEALEAQLEEVSALFPLDPGPHLEMARHRLAEGDAAGALAALSAARELAPARPEVLRLESEVLLALGRRDDAVAGFAATIAALGHDDALTRRVAALEGESAVFGSEWRVTLDEARAIEEAASIEGNPPVVTLSETLAVRVQDDGLATRFMQVIRRVRSPEQASFARQFQFSYSPRLQQPTILEAKLIRRDGTVHPAIRDDRPILPDPEIRMWYDSRVFTLVFPRLEEGDLIEVRYLLSDRGPRNLIGEGYFGQVQMLGRNVPVLSSRVVYESPQSLPLRHHLVNFEGEALLRHERREDRLVRVVDIGALPAYEDAGDAPPATARVPYVVLGSVASWEELGRLYAELIADQARLGPDLRRIVEEVAGSVRDREEIVRRLYNWVIENTRYVALEFGIHALKPYAVDAVYERRFGDCKDKATLLVAMLREAGVDSYVTLIRTRERGPMDTEVPTFAAFNHAIVHVPGEELWLDGTVLHFGAGELPYGDRGALVLHVDPFERGPGVLGISPDARPEDARLDVDYTIELEPGGLAALAAEIEARGESAARERFFFRNADRPARILGNRLRALDADATLVDARFIALELDDEVVRYRYDAKLPRFGRVEGTRVSLPLAFDVPSLPVATPSPTRELPIELPSPFEQRISASLRLPEGARLVELPRGARVESPWGRLALSVRQRGEFVEVGLALRFAGGRVAVEEIEEFTRFLREARSALEQRIVIEEPRG